MESNLQNHAQEVTLFVLPVSPTLFHLRSMKIKFFLPGNKQPIPETLWGLWVSGEIDSGLSEFP